MSGLKIYIFVATAIEADIIRAGKLSNAVEIVTTGVRARHLPAISDALAIVVAGYGGALDPSLHIGDIVVDAPGGMIGRWRTGRIHTADHIIATPAEKAELFARTGAIAVDMEQAYVRPLAERLGLPLIGVRAISDRADHALDPSMLSFLDVHGHVRPIALAKHLIRRPHTIPQMIRLGLHARKASKQLTAAIGPIVNALATAAARQTPPSRE